MNCNICGRPMERVQLCDTYTCEKCQIEAFPDYASGEWLEKKKKYYHAGDGVIRKTKETKNNDSRI